MNSAFFVGAAKAVADLIRYSVVHGPLRPSLSQTHAVVRRERGWALAIILCVALLARFQTFGNPVV
ncbi:hypothetical protein [Sphingobium nicotianae]|uniref:Uncharacterized protein n=1 Tax=Sphingobium nicotianae TaxID=2782607 RepID=A0A9X1DFN7_9SPHN|nr:hypothetical protein [Sphingobium nicotianae]MBT2188991.1 hypothetical protein [Sphingobium nicotianae]